MDCIFCKIISGEIPCKKIYEDENMLAFHDINPVAPVHFLVIPKTHIESANDIADVESGVIAKIFAAIPNLAKEQNLENGYRIINNCGEYGCQTVSHIHFHVIGGKQLGWGKDF